MEINGRGVFIHGWTVILICLGFGYWPMSTLGGALLY